MTAYVYIIESLLDRSYYIGSTYDLGKRLEKHNAGMSKYTSKKLPWEIKYYEQYPDMKSARKRGSFFKETEK
jgi:putative endonuclease